MTQTDRIKIWFYNQSFRRKILLSFLLVTVLPVLTLGSCILIQTNISLARDEDYALENIYNNCLISLDREVSKVERTLETVALDPVISEVLNSEYHSRYDRYYKVTKHFDAVIDTILSTDTVVESFDFYVPNSLQGVRRNFHSLAVLEQDPFYSQVDSGHATEWFYDGNTLYVYRRIYNLMDTSQFTMMKATVRLSAIVDPVVFDNAHFVLMLRGEVLSNSRGGSASLGGRYKSAEIFGGSGRLELYRGATSFFPASITFSGWQPCC